MRDRDGFRNSERVVETEKDALIFLSLLSSFYQLIVLEVGLIKRNIIASEAHSIDNALEENKYCIRLNAGFVLDCKMNSSGENPICYLSMANSASNCFNISQGTKAKNNCEINIIQNPPSVILYANQQIDPHVELCWLY